MATKAMGTRWRQLLGRCMPADDSGAVMLEYVIILCLVALGGVGATLSLGQLLLKAFLAQRTWLALPFP